MKSRVRRSHISFSTGSKSSSPSQNWSVTGKKLEVCMEERRSNYDITRDRVEGEFPRYDQESVIEKFHLAHDGDCIYIRFAAQDYRISRGTGRVERMEWSWKGAFPVDEAPMDHEPRRSLVLMKSGPLPASAHRASAGTGPAPGPAGTRCRRTAPPCSRQKSDRAGN